MKVTIHRTRTTKSEVTTARLPEITPKVIWLLKKMAAKAVKAGDTDRIRRLTNLTVTANSSNFSNSSFSSHFSVYSSPFPSTLSSTFPSRLTIAAYS